MEYVLICPFPVFGWSITFQVVWKIKLYLKVPELRQIAQRYLGREKYKSQSKPKSFGEREDYNLGRPNKSIKCKD